MDCIVRDLRLNSKNVYTTSSPTLFAVVVHNTWLKKWLKNIEVDNSVNNIDFTLQPGESVPYPWKKVFIRVLNKKLSKVLPLPRYKLSEVNDSPLTFSQLLQYVSQNNQRNLWKESYKKYSQNIRSNKETAIVNLLEHDQLLTEVIMRLYGTNIIKLRPDGTGKFEVKELSRPVTKTYDTQNNLLAAMFTLESENNIFIVYRSHYENSLLDCLNFSPNIIDKTYARGLFVIYQLLYVLKAMGDRGLCLGSLDLRDIFLTEDLWLQVMPSITNNVYCLDPSLICEQSQGKQSNVQSQVVKSKNSLSDEEGCWRNNAVKLEKLCMLWVRGQLSNLDYLLHLNSLAGRSANDPQAHFMVPWVTDFSSRCGHNWRDLTKSKYRLNKGDRQLDMTYDVTGCSGQIPHHVTDALSDITCYVYLARRTPKETLCKYVRNKWVPAEYPASIQRMQEWTPDECIPEFYTDPSVFKSIHEDLPDLGIPTWATCVEDFITKHREALESSHVSENLHHWIDITFGYKLSGPAAIKAKNVCLSLVDQHMKTRRGTAVQLLAAPHPPRKLRPLPPAPPRLRWTTPRDTTMYGEQLIIFQYLPHMGELIASCRRRLSAPLEGGVVACLQLLKYLLPYMADGKVMEQLQDTFLKSILQPALRLACTSRSSFPSGAAARCALTRKLLDALHALALRIGPEMTRKHLCVPALQRFFLAFDKATGKTDNWPKQEDPNTEKATDQDSEPKLEGFLEICRDGSTAEWAVRDGRVVRADLPELACTPPSLPDSHDAATLTAQEELLVVFDSELAYHAYTRFTKLVGTDAIERALKNSDTIRNLCQEYRLKHCISSPLHITQDKRVQSSFSDEPLKKYIDITPKQDLEHISNSNSFGSNVTLVGNRIDVASDVSYVPRVGFDIVAYKGDGCRSDRHLRGDWLIYWEHEIGRADKEARFNLKQIKLQSFSGHTHSVKSIHCLDNENSFMSGSKDKTVRLWSLRNMGDGNAITQCNWTYTGHKKGVLSLAFLESLRLAVSTDSVVHIWDPFMESVVCQLDHLKSPVSIVRTLPGPSSVIVAATTDASIRLIDARSPSHNHELKLPSNTSTFIRCMCVSGAGGWVAVGLAGGQVAILEPRTGLPRAHWRAHDGEVLRLAAVDEHRLLSSGLDQVTALWKVEDGELITHLKGITEPAHCLSVYYNELISGTTNNRIGVHTSLDQDASFSSTKLRSDSFKGVLTCMSVLPLNRLLLLGSDNGNISLLC
ncbi:WD repeat-containing protein 81 isoform X2 [Pieris napi]|uniref:WD repeat-containing protein 81 isoform X2 n=1 Tax=Pieris napi TaxID=78633 RepID=UPI001FBAAD88|nr:WD repeat-containing protein 81 isoform X2 [Pieris napi]